MNKLTKFLSIFIIVFTSIVTVGSLLLMGYSLGFKEASNLQRVSSTAALAPSPAPITLEKNNTKIVYVTPRPQAKITWGGPDLWDAVNKRRVGFGVNPLQTKEELCTIASIRLNQILKLGSLDGHKGFTGMPTDRPDLKWIFDKYNIYEFLVSGAATAQEAVGLWENTLGHKELLNGGQFVWGCIYAQSGFGVAIAAY